MTDRAWIEIDFQNLRHNVQILNQAMPDGCQLMAVVKANAYGHGAQTIAAYLEQCGVNAFAVATVDEGIALRESGIHSEILILGYTDPSRAQELHCYDLMQTLVGYEHTMELIRQGYPIRAHIKIDTGMHRLGFNYDEADKIAECFSLPYLQISGIFSHMCVADSLESQDVEFTRLQIQRYYQLLDDLSSRGIAIPKTHLQSSYGLLNYPELKCSYVRAGIALYGVQSSSGLQTKLHLDLRPVLSLKSRIAQVRIISAGESVGYGKCFVAQRDSVIAVIPIGYADGLPRALSYGKAHVLINGYPAPIIGRICMDQLTVDVTDVPEAKNGMIVTIIGQDGNNAIAVEDLAKQDDSIANEILSRLGIRLRHK